VHGEYGDGIDSLLSLCYNRIVPEKLTNENPSTGTLNAKGPCHTCIPPNPVLKGGKKADKVERKRGGNRDCRRGKENEPGVR
jgi:hypothetical protein